MVNIINHSFFLRISFVFYKIGFDAILPYSLSACKLLLGFMTIIKKTPSLRFYFLLVAAHGFEPRTLRVWTECSSQLSYAAIFIWSWWPGLNWWPYPYQGYALPTELHQHRNQIIKMVAGAGLEPTTFGLWARRATNCSTPRWKLIKKVVERVGFEPTKRNAADLQSAPFSHSGTSPFGAGNRTWTHNLLITSQLLYQLSYAST